MAAIRDRCFFQAAVQSPASKTARGRPPDPGLEGKNPALAQEIDSERVEDRDQAVPIEIERKTGSRLTNFRTRNDVLEGKDVDGEDVMDGEVLMRGGDRLDEGAVAASAEDGDGVLVDAPRPLVPPGLYRARVVGKADRIKFQVGEKQVLHFELLNGPLEDSGGELRTKDPAPSHAQQYDSPQNAVLPRFYNVAHRDGRWRVAAGSHYAREWTIAAGRRAARDDRMGTHVFRNKVFVVRVATVDSDRDGDELPPAARYSVVRKIIRRVD